MSAMVFEERLLTTLTRLFCPEMLFAFALVFLVRWRRLKTLPRFLLPASVVVVAAGLAMNALRLFVATADVPTVTEGLALIREKPACASVFGSGLRNKDVAKFDEEPWDFRVQGKAMPETFCYFVGADPVLTAAPVLSTLKRRLVEFARSRTFTTTKEAPRFEAHGLRASKIGGLLRLDSKELIRSFKVFPCHPRPVFPVFILGVRYTPDFSQQSFTSRYYTGLSDDPVHRIKLTHDSQFGCTGVTVTQPSGTRTILFGASKIREVPNP